MCEEKRTPPSADRVAARALVIACVSCRGFIEQESEDPRAEEFRQRVVAWVEDLGIADEFEPWEKEVLATPLGCAADRQTTVNAAWMGESLGIFSWALRVADLPRYDEAPLPAEVANSLGFLCQRQETVLADPSLRSLGDRQRFADFMFAVHWRVMQFHLCHEPMDFVDTANTVWFGPLETRGMEFSQKDLAFRGKPISSLDSDTFRAFMSMTMERHRAANWLVGSADVYSETGTDT
jgi:hypothetical protein